MEPLAGRPAELKKRGEGLVDHQCGQLPPLHVSGLCIPLTKEAESVSSPLESGLALWLGGGQ